MRILALALIISIPSLLLAKEKVSISSEPAWLFPSKIDPSRKADLAQVNDGYYLELFDRQTNIINKTSYSHYIRHILNETGVQNASEVSVIYSPLYQTVVFHKVNVIRDGVVISRLNMKDIQVVQEETDVQDFQYNGDKRAFITLSDVRKNDRIEVSYSVIGANPVYNNTFSATIQFYNYNPIVNYFETIIAEPSRKLNLTYLNDCPHPDETTTADAHIFHWSNPPMKAWEDLERAPVWYDRYPAVTVSDFNNWNEVAKWAVSTYNNYQYQLPDALLQKIEKWKIKSEGDQDVFATLALRYVQNEIRYLGLETGINTHKPHEPKDVYAKAYGDCKDKALLFAMILRHENIPAYVALVNTEKGGDLYRAAPSFNNFNHAIVAIQRYSKFIYVDPTATMQKGELFENYIPTYGFALLVKDDESNLRQIPTAELNSMYIVETLDVSFDDTSTLNVYSLFKGGSAEKVRREFAGSSMKDMREGYEKYYTPIYDKIKMTHDITFRDDDERNTMLVEEAYNIPELWKVEGKKKVFDVYAKSLHEQLGNEPPASCDYPIALKYPLSIQYILEANMPEDWTFPTDEVHIKNDYYQFDFKSELKGAQVKLTYYYKTFSDNIPVAQLEQYRKDYKKMYEVLEYNLSYGATGESSAADDSAISWRAVSTTLTTFLIMAVLLVLLNRRTVEVEYDRNSGLPIGGWMVVLGISLCITLAFHFYNLFYGEYFKDTTWAALKQSGNDLVNAAMVELVISVVRVSSSVAIVIWFFKRRDIFPQMFLYYVALMFISQLTLYVTYSVIDIPDSYGNVKGATLRTLIQTCIYAGIWSAYILRAYRTKATFLKSS